MQIALIFIFQLAGILAIALISRYRLPDLTAAGWDTVIFLTPLGIARNYLNKNPVMRSFYSDYAREYVGLSFFSLMLMAIVILSLIALFVKMVKLLENRGL